MTTNKVHDCEKQQQAPQEPTPTSVTGEEWEEGLYNLAAINYNLYLSGTVERADTGQEWTFDDARWEIRDFIRTLLSTQRTHIKQALLGMMEILRKHPQVQSGDADPCGLLLDITNIINEELA